MDGKDKYASLLLTLPLYEAKHYYCQGYLETRIAPQRSYALLRKKYNRIVRLNAKQEDVPDYQLIYHFIKQRMIGLQGKTATEIMQSGKRQERRRMHWRNCAVKRCGQVYRH